MEESKNIQKPQDYNNYDDSIQDGLDGPLHGYKAIDEPQQNSHYDENHHYLK
jgi:hypothetical protein